MTSSKITDSSKAGFVPVAILKLFQRASKSIQYQLPVAIPVVVQSNTKVEVYQESYEQSYQKT